MTFSEDAANVPEAVLSLSSDISHAHAEAAAESPATEGLSFANMVIVARNLWGPRLREMKGPLV